MSERDFTNILLKEMEIQEISLLPLVKELHERTKKQYHPDIRTHLSLLHLRAYKQEIKRSHLHPRCPHCKAIDDELIGMELVYFEHVKGHGQRMQFNCKSCEKVSQMGFFLRNQ